MQTGDSHEREVKFFIDDPQWISTQLKSIGAEMIKEQVHEYNLRFDTPDQTLKFHHQVLRLRKDSAIRLTFKGASDSTAEVADREELEVTVGDFATTRSILERLGFQAFMVYEKYRTTYTHKGCEIVLDQLPFGHFIEIEGASSAEIKETAGDLGLDWEKRITASYLELFLNLKQNRNLNISSIEFAQFEGMEFTESDFFSV